MGFFDGGFGTSISSVAGLIGGVNSYKAQKEANEANVAMQRETNAMNERLTRESWARDDNAVQRRVADLKAAGMNPLLAAGSSAGNSSPVTMVAPSVNPAVRPDFISAVNTMFGLVSNVNALKQQKLDMLKTVYEMAHIGASTSSINEDISEKSANNELNKDRIQYQRKYYNAILKKLGIETEEIGQNIKNSESSRKVKEFEAGLNAVKVLIDSNVAASNINKNTVYNNYLTNKGSLEKKYFDIEKERYEDEKAHRVLNTALNILGGTLKRAGKSAIPLFL